MNKIIRLNDYLDSAAFPCDRGEILSMAEDADAPDQLLDELEELPNVRFRDLESVIVQRKAA